MQFEIEKLYNMYCIIINPTAGNAIIEEFGKRVICRLNNSIELHSALMPIKDGGYYITIGKTYLKKLAITEGSTVDVAFAKDTTALKFEIPEELIAVFETDEEALHIFNGLTDGNKRSLAYLVAAIKNTDTRIKRALLITEKLKLGITSARFMLK